MNMRICKNKIGAYFSIMPKARITFHDRVPIHPIPRADVAFSHWFMDILGSITSAKCDYNYCLILVDSATRYPAAFALVYYS